MSTIAVKTTGQLVVALPWFGAGVLLAAALFVMVHAIHRQAASAEELSHALWQFALPFPGAVILTLSSWGVSPYLLLVPAAVYGSILLLTRGRPLLMLGHTIERFDSRTSDRYVLISVGMLVVLFIILDFVHG